MDSEKPKPIFVKGDRKRIHQVLTNLIVNAVNYGSHSGVVVTSFYDMDKNILIEVTDDGEGIPEEQLPRLFERFYRVDSHRSREDGGSGLGLAIVKHIIEAHKQSINVRSTLGTGTTFGFTLPKA
jgi:two-component system phosphate regulon sensor histidine kinase PhoR